MKWNYRSSTIVLGPHATEIEAQEAVLTECRSMGLIPKGTAHVEQILPPETEMIVRYKPRKGPSRIINVAPDAIVGLLMRWRHSVHEEIVATRWWGYVEVKKETE